MSSKTEKSNGRSVSGPTMTPEETAKALQEARARGLPHGWSVKLDKRRRRKWIAPDGKKSCDSIPKAISISVELGLLPPDTPIPTSTRNSNKKRPAPASQSRSPKQKKQAISSTKASRDIPSGQASQKTPAKLKQSDSQGAIHSANKKDSSNGNKRDISAPTPPKSTGTIVSSTKVVTSSDHRDGQDSDPETSLDPPSSPNITVHWHPTGLDGRLVGWKIRVWDTKSWKEGRVIFYDPYTHKHKLRMEPGNALIVQSHDSTDRKSSGGVKPCISMTIWLRLSHETVQYGTKVVWALVKGFAWWPALVMDGDALENIHQATASVFNTSRKSNVVVSFFSSSEISSVKNHSDWLRPFRHGMVDAVINKNKKKRNVKAIQTAREEEVTICKVRRQACIEYAHKAFALIRYGTATTAPFPSTSTSSFPPGSLVGQRLEIFRSDVNYPYGDVVVGQVRKYNLANQKWLVSFETSKRTKVKYDSCWMIFPMGTSKKKKTQQKQATTFTRLDKSDKPVSKEDVFPFLHGYLDCEDAEDDTQNDEDEEKPKKSSRGRKKVKNQEKPTNEDIHNDNNDEWVRMLRERCKGCAECLKPNQSIVKCHKCHSIYHVGCTNEAAATKTGKPASVMASSQPFRPEGDDEISITTASSSLAPLWTCSVCTTCQGCDQQDIIYGTVPLPASITFLSFPSTANKRPMLCQKCILLYQKQQYCPNCLHVWDDARYERVKKRSKQSIFKQNQKQPEKKDLQEAPQSNDNEAKPDNTTNNADADDNSDTDEEDDEDDIFEMDPDVPVESDWYYEDSEIWGYTAGSMLGCDGCNLWVHAGCAGLSRSEYEQTSSGEHPIYSKEFLCRLCCKKRSSKLIELLKQEDNMSLFAMPVTAEMAPTYHDIIKKPMDLQTMTEKLSCEDNQKDYAWIREDFELMVLNALNFNQINSKFWLEARRFYYDCKEKVFSVYSKGTPVGTYESSIEECFQRAVQKTKMEEERVKQDETTEKKDLIAGNQVTTITTLPPLLQKPPDHPSCLPFAELKLKPVEAHYCSWMECCYTCGSSGAADTMLFCVDCGEAFHSFCVNAPIHSMDVSSASGWRCPNCKICEISGEVPADELKMLFCEMCDRAFNCDLLEPPLRAAPEGVWVCGQCVDCIVCKNTKEIRGASVKYWSSDPTKCYRCGGCGELGKPGFETNRCKVCDGVWRHDDQNLIACIKCKSVVHEHCDRSARECLSRRERHKYMCPSCSNKPADIDDNLDTEMRKFVKGQAWALLSAGTLPRDLSVSILESYERLCADIEWSIRDNWREDYMNIIDLGFAYINGLKSRDVDLRALVSRARAGHTNLPCWMAQRAARFLTFDAEKRWQVVGYGDKNIRSLAAVARMASAFIKLVISAFELDPKRDVTARADFNRYEKLLAAPLTNGIVVYPQEVLDDSSSKNIIHSKEWAENFEKKLQLPNGLEMGESRRRRADSVDYIFPHPVCGWNKHLDSMGGENEWRDPRACCLCRTCGDDDGANGNPDKTVNGAELARMGRLLPMPDGNWVHASCALWSSEVFEKQGTRLIHAMEKAKSRGSQLKCFGCGRPGATVGCQKANCSKNYHFPCAKACGAVFTNSQQMFCEAHKSYATDELVNANVEHMKTLKLAAEEKKIEAADPIEDSCSRVGTLIVHSLGEIEQSHDGFHSEKYITPPGYCATRIFWSMKTAKTRTVYILKVERSSSGDNDVEAAFSIIPGDDPSGSAIQAKSPAEAYNLLIQQVQNVNQHYFSRGNVFSKLPVKRKTTKKAFGLNGYQFFGFGLNHVRQALETLPGVEAVVAPLSGSSPSYQFVYSQPTIESVLDLQRKRAAIRAENALENLSGSARTEGMKAVARSGGSGRITRALVRSAENADDVGGTSRSDNNDDRRAKASAADRESNQEKYRELKSVPLEHRMAARRSHIHGWGLFCKVDIPKDGMIVEYMGECVRQCIADKREKEYEKSGIGSCYLFRLDWNRVVDATTIGCMARFMNHSCSSNAYAKVITVDTEFGPEKKIVVFANRAIAAGEEITYDYKFPVEDGSLKCTCGAPNCIGRMN